MISYKDANLDFLSSLSMNTGRKKDAMLSYDKKHRYHLFRFWDLTKPSIVFIMLNPSTADEEKDDPTIRKCVQYAKNWGYGLLFVVNLFSYRTTDPSVLKKADKTKNEYTDMYISQIANNAKKVICAWGSSLKVEDRVAEVKNQILCDLYALKINKDGNPTHPLFLKGNLKPILYQRVDGK